MISLSRSVATVFLACFLITALMGCGQALYQPPSGPIALEDIETKVPKVLNLPLKKAELVLAIVALKVGQVTFEETKDPSLHGMVFDQEPLPGTPARGGTQVNLKVYRFVAPEEQGLPAGAK